MADKEEGLFGGAGVAGGEMKRKNWTWTSSLGWPWRKRATLKNGTI